MKILFFDTRASTNKLDYFSYYSGLFQELNLIADVDLIKGPISELPNGASQKYDAIVFGLGWFANESPAYYQKIKGLKESKIPVVCNLHKVANQTRDKINFLRQNSVDLTLMSPGFVTRFQDKFEDLRFELFPFAANEKIFFSNTKPRNIEIGFSGALHTLHNKGVNEEIKNGFTKQKAQLRTKMFEIISDKFSETKSFINTGITNSPLPENKYAEILRDTLVWFATDSPAEEVSPRHYEVMLSKTALMCNEIPVPYRGIFVDGINCIEFRDDLSDFEKKLRYYLNNKPELDKIVLTAYDDAVANHTWANRAKSLINKIEDVRLKKQNRNINGE